MSRPLTIRQMIDPTAIIVAVIAATPGSIIAYAAWNATKQTHKLVNSRMDELLRKAKIEATEDERDRVAAEKKNGE